MDGKLNVSMSIKDFILRAAVVCEVRFLMMPTAHLRVFTRRLLGFCAALRFAEVLVDKEVREEAKHGSDVHVPAKEMTQKPTTFV